MIVSSLSVSVPEVRGTGSVLGMSMADTKEARFGLELEPGVV